MILGGGAGAGNEGWGRQGNGHLLSAPQQQQRERERGRRESLIGATRLCFLSGDGGRAVVCMDGPIRGNRRRESYRNVLGTLLGMPGRLRECYIYIYSQNNGS